jgi:hypothetical protein
MDIGSIFLILALAVVAFLFISRPFFESNSNQRLFVSTEVQQREHERSALLAERDRVLNALLELESDHDLEKMLPEDYTSQREALMKTGADVLRRLDEINLQDEPAVSPQPERSLQEDDELEAMIAARKQAKQQYQAFCANCGSALKPGDKFCAVCGAKTGG